MIRPPTSRVDAPLAGPLSETGSSSDDIGHDRRRGAFVGAPAVQEPDDVRSDIRRNPELHEQILRVGRSPQLSPSCWPITTPKPPLRNKPSTTGFAPVNAQLKARQTPKRSLI